MSFPGGPHGPGGSRLYRAFWEQEDPMSCGDVAQPSAWLPAAERRGVLGWEGGIAARWDWEHPEHPAGMGSIRFLAAAAAAYCPEVWGGSFTLLFFFFL